MYKVSQNIWLTRPPVVSISTGEPSTKKNLKILFLICFVKI